MILASNGGVDPWAWAFIDNDGVIWKAASWKTPAKNFPRGKIEDLSNHDQMKKWEYGV